MRKINFIFAAVFAAALAVGGINMYAAVGVADKNGAINTVNDSGSLRRFGVVAGVAKRFGALVNKNSTDAVNQKNVNAVRKGRKIQVDGFLLEWRGADANVWPGSGWLWDAVSTVEGVAGYISLPVDINSDNNPRIDTIDGHNINTDKNIGNDTDSSAVNNPGINAIDTAAVNNGNSINASSRPAWVFTLRAVNTGRSLEFTLPGRPSGEFFAFDKGAYDAGGPLTAEWVVPWDFFDDDGDSAEYELSINAASAGGGAPRPLVLTVEAPEEARAPAGLLTRLAMLAFIAALTVALVVARRRRAREAFPVKRV